MDGVPLSSHDAGTVHGRLVEANLSLGTVHGQCPYP